MWIVFWPDGIWSFMWPNRFGYVPLFFPALLTCDMEYRGCVAGGWCHVGKDLALSDQTVTCWGLWGLASSLKDNTFCRAFSLAAFFSTDNAGTPEQHWWISQNSVQYPSFHRTWASLRFIFEGLLSVTVHYLSNVYPTSTKFSFSFFLFVMTEDCLPSCLGDKLHGGS